MAADVPGKYLPPTDSLSPGLTDDVNTSTSGAGVGDADGVAERVGDGEADGEGLGVERGAVT